MKQGLKKLVFPAVCLLAALGMIFVGCSTGGGDDDDDGSVVVIPGQRDMRTLSGVSVPFRFVPAGSFQRDIVAQNNVSVITTGYWMGETEVTQELFEAVMGPGVKPSYFTSNPEDVGADGWKKLPVEQVSWYDAIAFCNKLSLAEGKEPVYSVSGVNWNILTYSAIPTTSDSTWDAATMDTAKNGYRLPTEMEWMWAAMGADTVNPGQPNISGYSKPFAGSTGSNSIGDYAWYDGNSGNKTHEVGNKDANELGLYDMSGNVGEWCWDRSGSYPSGERTNYTGATSGTDRVVRGGGWAGGYCTVADRYSANPIGGSPNTGLHVVSP
jgi:formylglycine-generating enzyme required for sulfatase activity